MLLVQRRLSNDGIALNLTRGATIMDTQTAINLIGGAVLAVVGWFARQIFQAMRDLEKDLRHLEVNLPTNYVSKTDFSETMRDIKAMFQKIFDKLDDKEDKQNR